LAWIISYDEGAKKDLEKIDRQIARRIRDFMIERVAPLENPRSIGEALRGSKLGEFWKYRVGDYRVIASIEDGVCRILVVKVGNRKNVYR
jgi:mRNA interferase RelE/StbE